MLTRSNNILALDVGERRIGVARASLIARLPQPLKTIQNSAAVADDIQTLVLNEDAAAIVVGLPRGMQGQETEQTRSIIEFVKQLEHKLTIPIYMQDETLTSVQAEKELMSNGKSADKMTVDELAATYILEDFLSQHKELPPK